MLHSARQGASILACLFGVAASVAAQETGSTEALPPGAIRRLGTNRFRPGHDVRSLAASPDGKHLVITGFNTISLLNASTGEMVRRFGHHYPVRATFTPDGKALLVAASGDDGTRRMDLETEKEFNLLIPKGFPIRICAFSPDRTRLAFVGPPDNHVHLWDIEEKKPLRTFPVPGNVWHLAWSRDGKALGLTVQDKIADVADRFLVWDAVTGKELLRLVDEKPGWRAFAFSPTEDLVALARRWGNILLIDFTAPPWRAGWSVCMGRAFHWRNFSAECCTCSCAGSMGSMIRRAFFSRGPRRRKWTCLGFLPS